MPAQDDFKTAAIDNSDGIGVMSADGIAKFSGRKGTRRAYAYCRKLSRAAIPFGVHFRYATHGAVSRALTHPFQVPETQDYVMHNGIIGETARFATATDSDTSIFVREFMPYYPCRKTERADWLADVSMDTYGSRLLVMSADGADFDIVHADAGDWCEGIWYSNNYSLVSAATKPIHYRRAVSLVKQYKLTPARQFDWQDFNTWDLYPSQARSARVHGSINRFGSESDDMFDTDGTRFQLGDDPFNDDMR
jgi:hypothetical protein